MTRVRIAIIVKVIDESLPTELLRLYYHTQERKLQKADPSKAKAARVLLNGPDIQVHPLILRYQEATDSCT